MLKKQNRSKLIPLSEAVKKVSGYSMDYLSLRARQGKLKAEKVGRNWHTTLEWIDEYVGGDHSIKNVSVRLPKTASPRVPKKRSRLGSAVAARSGMFVRLFEPTRLLAASLTATIAFMFVAPPQVWAHWGENTAEAIGRSINLAAGGSVSIVSSLASDPRFTEVAAEIKKAVTVATTSVARVTDKQNTAAQHLAVRFGLDDEDSIAHRGGGLQNDGSGGGVVAGAETIRNLVPQNLTFSAALGDALALPGDTAQQIITLANPADLSVAAARLSGQAIELSSKMSVGSVLQPVGTYVARITAPLRDSAPAQDAPLDEPSIPFAEVAYKGTPGPSWLGAASDGTFMVGEIPLQNAVTVFHNRIEPGVVAFQLISLGGGDILQGVSSSGNTVFGVSDAGTLSVTRVSTASVATGSLLVSGSGTIAGSLAVKGPAIFAAITANGAAVFNDTITAAKDIHALADIIVDAAIRTNTLAVANEATFSGPATFNGATTVNAPLRVNNTITANNAVITGSLNVNGDTTLADNTTIGGNLTVSRNLTVGGTFSPRAVITSGPVSGYSVGGVLGSFDQFSSDDASFGRSDNNTFNVNATASFRSPVTLQSTLAVQNAATIESTLAVSGASTLTGNTTIGGTLTVAGATEINNTLAISGGTINFGDGTGTTTLSSAQGNFGIGTTTPSALLSVGGSSYITGVLTVESSVTMMATSTTQGQAIFTASALGVGEVNTASSTLYINPSVTVADANILGIANNGSFRFRVDAEGDTYISGNLITTGSVTQAETDITENLTVAGSTVLGDAPNSDTLTVNGATKINATSTTPALAIDQDGSGDILALTAGANQFLRATSKGFLGIGTTTAPVFALQIATSTATQFATGYNTSNYLSFSTDSLGTTTINAIGGAFASIIIADPLRVATSSTNAFEVLSGATTTLVVDTSANRLGIGTSTPSALLAVAGNTLIQGTLRVQSAAAFDSTLSVTGASSLAQVTIAAGSAILAAGANSNIGSVGTPFDTINADTINATNLIGTVVGGQTNSATWTINKDNATADTEAMSLVFERGTLLPNATLSWNTTTHQFETNFNLALATTSPAIVFDSSTAGDTDFWAGVIADGGGTSNDYFRIGSGTALNASTFLTIDSTGNVGIGTTTPGELLHIASATDPTLLIDEAGGNVDPSLIFKADGANFAQLRLDDDNSNVFQILVGSGVSIIAATFDNSGNLGLGDTSPDAHLEISANGTTGGSVFLVSSDDDNDGDLFTIKESGNIGIANTAPSFKLDVTGNARFTSLVDASYFVATSTTATSTFNFISSGTGNLELGGKTSSNNVIINRYGGNVGIGTTTPASLLSVGGSTYLGGVLQVRDATTLNSTLSVTGASTLSSTLAVTDTVTLSANLLVNSTTATSTFSHGVSIGGVMGVTSGTIALGTGSATTTITSTGANLGIINTAPTFNLDVTGNARFTSLVDASYFVATSTTATSTFNFISSGTGNLEIGGKTSSNNVIINRYGGNVGIGTSTPGRFNGGWAPSGLFTHIVNNGDAYLAVTAKGVSIPYVAWEGENNDGGSRLIMAGYVNNWLSFSSYNESTGAAVKSNMLMMNGSNGNVVMSAGNVGIINTTPTFNLDVTGNARFTSLVDASYFVATSTTATSTFNFISSGTGNLELGGKTSSNNVIINRYGGNLGIASTTPNWILSVNGNGNGFAVNTSGNIVQGGYQGSVIGEAYGGTGLTTIAAGSVLAANSLDTLSAITSTSGLKVLQNSAGTVSWASTTGTGNVVYSASPTLTGLLTAANATTTLLTVTNDTYLATAGGNVGIGTTAPLVNLDVRGTGTTNGDTRVISAVYDTTSFALGVGGTITVGGKYNTAGDVAAFAGLSGEKESATDGNLAGYLSLSTRPAGGTLTDRLRITSTGNVGIGTTTPSYLLDVYGTSSGISSTLRGAAAYTMLNLDNNATNGGWAQLAYNGLVYGYLGSGSNIITGSATSDFDIRATNNLIFGHGLTETMRIDTSGNVGIGTTGPAAKLHLDSASNEAVGLIIEAGSTDGQDAYVLFRDGGSAGKYLMGYDDSADIFNINTGTSFGSNFVIDSAGKIGIGTTTPWGLLAVNPNGLGAGVPAFVVGSSTATSLVVTNGGNVGIGTAAPGHLLDVRGAGTSKGAVTGGPGAPDSYFAQSYFTDADGDGITLGALNGTLGSTYGVISTAASGDGLLFNTRVGGVENARMVINNGGNVGIGTTTPSELLTLTAGGYSGDGLSVAGNASNQYPRIQLVTNGATVNKVWSISNRGGAAGELYIDDNTAGATRFMINASGNVGIGTTTPQGLLAIEQGTETYSLYIGNQGSSTPSLVVRGVNGNGNVGIGTAAPGNILNVLSNSPVIEMDVNSGALGRTSALRFGATFGTGADTSAFNAGDISAGYTGSTLDTNYMAFQIHNAAGSGLEVMRITQGNVGIGTTAPSGNLHVSGSATSIISEGSTRGDFFAIDSGAGTNLKRVVMRSLDGNLTIGGENDAISDFRASMTIQAGYAGNGNVGIGTTTPGAVLDVVGANILLRAPTSTSYGALRIASNSGTQEASMGFFVGDPTNTANNKWTIGYGVSAYDGFGFYDNAGTAGMRMVIAPSTGNVGIGTTSPATLLEVGGSTNNVTLDGYKNCTGYTSNGNGLLACTASDQRMKQSIATLASANGLVAINALNPVAFYWRPEADRGAGEQYGLIAQDVQGVFPNLVSTTNPTALTPDGTLVVNYEGLTAPIVLAIQQLDARTKFIANAATSEALTVDASGNVGIGQNSLFSAGSIAVGLGAGTSPLAPLHVVGQCVTGDTLLAIRRRRKKKGEKDNDPEEGDDNAISEGAELNAGQCRDWEYMFVRIDQIKAGDEVLSLNEATNRAEYRKVKALMDMGVKKIYEIRTKSGRVIRTTANHPYLVRLQNNGDSIASASTPLLQNDDKNNQKSADKNITFTSKVRDLFKTREELEYKNRDMNSVNSNNSNQKTAHNGAVSGGLTGGVPKQTSTSQQITDAGSIADGKNLSRGGTGGQGARTPSPIKRTNHLSDVGASTGALPTAPTVRRTDNNTNFNENAQNKNTLAKGEDVLDGPRKDGFATPDKYLQNSTSENSVKGSVLEIHCPYCTGSNFVKRGTRKKKLETVQLYWCNACERTFTPGSVKGKRYPMEVILDAMSLYNIGHSIAKAARLASAIYHKNLDNESVPQKSFNLAPGTLSAWLEQYRPLCAYARMRPFGIKLLPPEKTIESATLAHRQLYRFRHHKVKSHLIIEEDYKNHKFAPLREFLEQVPGETPHQYFQEGMRASDAPLGFSKTEMIVRAKKNYATRIASFVLQSVSRNKDRHDALQRFMLATDSVTVATEVPVYIRREDMAHMQTQLGFTIFKKAARRVVKSAEDLKVMAVEELPKLITGHIDFLQIRNGFCHIMDYKPNAEKERPMEQLVLYALALSRLTGLRVYDFKCAWFDENDYFEFFPLHLVYKRKKRKQKRVETIEGRYRMNKDPGKMQEIRPEEQRGPP